jgi:multidrug resistance protein
MQFLFAPIWGRISDRVGRRPIILLGLFGSAVSYLIFGLAHSLSVLFISRVCAGIAGANISTAQAYIADSTPPERRARGMGLVGAAYGLGFIFGPAIGGTLSHFALNLPPLFASALSFCNFVAALFLLPESLQPENRTSHSRRGLNLGRIRVALMHPQLGIFMMLFFIVTFAFANLEATFALMQGALIGHLVGWVGERKLISVGLFSMIFGLGLLPFAPSLFVLLIVLAILTFGQGVTNPSITSSISQVSGPGDQGGILGVTQSLGSLARILGPIWGGLVFDHLGFQYPYLTGGLLMMLAFVLSVSSLRPKAQVAETA